MDTASASVKPRFGKKDIVWGAVLVGLIVSGVLTSSWLLLFLAVVEVLFYLDLYVLEHWSESHPGLMSLLIIGIGMAFSFVVYEMRGIDGVIQYQTGYWLEKSLSVDNLFIFMVIFDYFRLNDHQRRRVLTVGIVTALILRGIMIFVGAAAIQAFHPIIYFFGAILLYTAIKMARESGDDDEDFDPLDSPAMKIVDKLGIPQTDRFVGDKFWVTKAGFMLTPLAIVAWIVEVTDVIFAVDSIPAIFGVTTDTFIIFTSNIFAILGLRALFFVLGSWIKKFHLLKLGLSLVLGFIAIKMLLPLIEGALERGFHIETHFEIGNLLSVAIVFGILILFSVLSLVFPQPERTIHHEHVRYPEGPEIERASIPAQGLVTDGYRDWSTNNLQLILGNNDWLKGQVINAALVLDASRSMNLGGYYKPETKKRFWQRRRTESGPSPIEAFVRRAGPAIANYDTDGNVLLMLSCLHDKGKGVSVVGNREDGYTAGELATLKVRLNGPDFGDGAHLLPAINEAYRLLTARPDVTLNYIFVVTERVRFDDFPKLISSWAIKAINDITAGKMVPTKIVLISLGGKDSSEQAQELDNLDFPVDLDLFDARHVNDLDEACDLLFSEPISSSHVKVATRGELTMPDGLVIHKWSDGVPQTINVTLPDDTDRVYLSLDGAEPVEVMLHNGVEHDFVEHE